MRLRDSEHTVEELTDHLVEMKAQIRDWVDEFGVESPNHLRTRDSLLDSLGNSRGCSANIPVLKPQKVTPHLTM